MWNLFGKRDRLPALLQSVAGLERALDIIDGPDRIPCCPRCQADRPYRHGHANGLQRYRCRMCSRSLTGKGALRKQHLLEHLAPRLERDVLLVTDSHAVYLAFARAMFALFQPDVCAPGCAVHFHQEIQSTR